MAFGTQFYGNGALNPHDPKAALPKLSYALDSVRTHQFEVHIEFPNAIEGISQNGLTLAAKQVSTYGFNVADIEVHRANDKVFYPGKPSPEELTITFDNLLHKEGDAYQSMWQWFKRGYNPVTGEMMTETGTNEGADLGGGNQFKAKRMSVVLLKGNLDHIKATEFYGVYPKAYKTAEFNYSTGEFHTIEVTFRYDYMDSFSESTILSTLGA